MNIALLTGRGKSLSLPDKNIIKVLGRPMFTYPALMAQRAKTIDDIYISTDGEALIEIAKEIGIKIIKRPSYLAQPDSQHKDAILHALEELKKQNICPEILVVLLCNVGTHASGMIDKCVNILLKNKNIDSVVTVDERNEYHPLRAKKIGGEGFLEPFISYEKGQKISTNRQDLEPCYFLDHSIWALRVENCFKENSKGQPPWDFMGNKIMGVPLKGAIDIHSIEDISYTERWLLENGWTEEIIPD